jgi:oxygen-dependent protoporphyrinogen oxidase
MVEGMDKSLSSLLQEIYYPSIAVVCLGFRREKILHDLMGFGFLIPFREGRRILGTLWDSSIFPNRAPEGYALLRTMLGGARRSDLALERKEKLVAVVMDELRDIMGINAQPDFARVYTHQKGIPQYFLGHEQKTEKIRELCRNYKGFYVTGNAYGGIGVNDCIENSARLAERILEGI